MDRWNQIRELFHAAAELPPEERAAYLRRACAEDDVRREVEELLSRASKAGSFLEGSPLSSGVTPAPGLQPGDNIGRFQIAALIGAGGMGQVYRARDERLKREVAIKVLPPAFARDEARMRRFEHEASAAGRLNHPNIVAIYDLGVENGSPYVVCELLDGETLRRRLEQSAIPVRKAVAIAREVASGLAAAHDKGIAHRDLKPENIFLVTNGPVKILDFGLAKITETARQDGATATMLTDAGITVGTAGYMSPEQLRGEPLDRRTDIFSFGVVLFEMLAGRRPFSGESSADVLGATLREEPPDLAQINPAVPAPLSSLVRHCLEKRAADRFESARDLAVALEWMGGAVSGEDSTKTRTPVLPSRRAFWAASGAAAIAAAGGGWILARRTARLQPPSFHRLTFRRGTVASARFAPDAKSIVYSAAWDGNPVEMFSTRPESSESRPFDMPGANILGISSAGEMALTLRTDFSSGYAGTLARASLGGGAPREILENVADADWSRDGVQLAVIRDSPWQLEFPIGKVLYRAPRGAWLSHARISPHGDRIAFFNHDAALGDPQGSIAMVDLAGNMKPVSGRFVDLSGLCWSTSGDELWATVAEQDFAYALIGLRPSGARRTLMTFPNRGVLFDVAADGRLLIGQETQTCIVRGVMPDQPEERDLGWQDGSFARAMSPDGKVLIFDEELMAGQRTGHVYLRRAGAGEPVRLGDGFAIALSPDGQWVLAAYRHTTPVQLWALPTGAGQSVRLPMEGVNFVELASWFPDSRRIAISGNETGRPGRVWETSLDGGKPRPITPEGAAGGRLTPDGKYVMAADPADGKRRLFPVAGGPPESKPGLQAQGGLIGFSTDGKYVFLRRGRIPAQIFRVALETGQAEPWRKLAPPDTAGILALYGNGTALSGDGRCYAYTFVRALGDLYVVEGVS